MKNTILFSIIDREDLWISDGLSFDLDDSPQKTYKDAYEQLKEKIHSKEVTDYVQKSRVGDYYYSVELMSIDYDDGLVFMFFVDGEEMEIRYDHIDFIRSF